MVSRIASLLLPAPLSAILLLPSALSRIPAQPTRSHQEERTALRAVGELERPRESSRSDLPLRIGLVRYFSQVERLVIAAPPGACLRDAKGVVRARGPGIWSFVACEHGIGATDVLGQVLATDSLLRLESPHETRPFALSVPGRQDVRRYRGLLELTTGEAAPLGASARRGALMSRSGSPDRSGGAGAARLHIVNILPLETYLRGVVPAEMPPSALPEALRAQAVVARTYALANRGRHRAQGYDLRDTTDDQVYGGVEAEREWADAAVRDTTGLVLMRGGRLVRAHYHADCGGATSPGEMAGDYPPSVADIPLSGGPDYCARGTYHTWRLRLSAEELARRLDAATRKEVGPLQEIILLEADVSGRARRVLVRGEQGCREMAGSAFRAMLGPTILKSTRFTVAREPGGAFIFQGRGYGHGRGLCQWGAIGMADAPYHHSFRTILSHYYPGTDLSDYGRGAETTFWRRATALPPSPSPGGR